MKIITIYTFLWICVGVVLADDVMIRFPGKGTNTMFVISTNEMSFGGLHWDGPDGGGSEEILVVREEERVVVTYKVSVTTEMTNSLHGIEKETTSKTFISLDLLPYTLAVDGTTVTVFRAEHKMDNKKSPNKTPEPSVAPAPQAQR